MNVPLICYRISGWLVTLTNISLSFFAIKTKRMWQGKYLFLGIEVCFVAIANIIASITAILLINNLFIDYIYIPIVFTLKALYLREYHKNKYVRWSVFFLIFFFIFINIINAFYQNGYKEFNTLGSVINTSFFLGFAIWNLTKMFKDASNIKKLRQNPDFWFTASIFCFAFLGLMSGIITDISYKAGSDLVLYVIYISENLVDVIIYYGYYRGIKLLK